MKQTLFCHHKRKHLYHFSHMPYHFLSGRAALVEASHTVCQFILQRAGRSENAPRGAELGTRPDWLVTGGAEIIS